MQTLRSLCTLRSFHRLRNDSRGVITVELALISSVIFVLLIPLSDLVVRIYNGQQLSSATRAALQYALANPDDTSGIEAAATSNAGSLDTEQMTVDTSEFCECNGTAHTCGDVCAYGEETYMSVTATYTQTLMMDYPGYGNEVPISRELTVRVE